MKLHSLFLIIIIFIYVNVNAQEPLATTVSSTTTTNSSPEKNRVFGLGIKLFNVLGDLNQTQNITYGNKLIFTINAHPNFRIQPEIGYNRASTKNEQLSDDLVDNTLQVGIGFFGMWKMDRTNIYLGLKYLSTSSDLEYARSQSSPNYPFISYTKETTTQTINSFGLVLGGEYLFGTHFSIGTEAGLLTSDSNIKDSVTPQTNSKSSYFSTETNLIVRFYF